MAVGSRNGPGVEPLDRKRLLDISQNGPEFPEVELEFRQLEYFVAVAEELHFGRAASRLFISQPALSQAIAGLERALDVKLFIRSRQSVEITGAGAELLRHARGLLSDRESAVASVRRIDRGEAGVLRVGVALLAEQQVAPAFTALTAESHDLLLDRSAAVSERLLASVRNRDLHAAIVHQVPVLATLEDVEWETIRQGRLAALVNEKNELAGRDSVPLSELSAERFMVPPRELAPSAFEGLKTMCSTYGGFEPEVVELSTYPLGTDWGPVTEGEAIALMPEASAQAAGLDGAEVVAIEPPPLYSLAIAWRAGNGSPILDRFLDFMLAYRDEHDWVEQPVIPQGV